ncbi:MAG: hypothetical protein ISR65_11535 [Bacteriovoracaceae bacterium]|nr:hypothetical protein [Bacteriovoracaceae bacterium]
MSSFFSNLNKKAISFSLFLLFSTSLIESTLAASNSDSGSNCHSFLNRLARRLDNIAPKNAGYKLLAKKESAVELEMELNNRVIRLLTTEDGTIGPLFTNEAQKLTKEEFASTLHIKVLDDVYKTPWDSLAIRQKRSLLEHVTKLRGVEFTKDRILHGVKVKEFVEFDLFRPMTFQGKVLLPGHHKVKISDLIKKVEIRSNGDVKSLQGIELHFRGNMKAGTMSEDARKLQKKLRVSTHQHVHIVGDLPKELFSNPVPTSLEIADFYRRVNLLAELSVVKNGGNIGKRKTVDGHTLFDNLSPFELKSVVTYLLDISDGKHAQLGDKVKMAFAGFRGSDKYDAPNLFGIEYRVISHGLSSSEIEFTTHVLNKIQQFMERTKPNVPAQKRIMKWFNEVAGGNDPADALSKVWYDVDDWGSIFHNAPEQVKDLLTPNLKDQIRKSIVSSSNDVVESTSGDQIKWLLHDWSTDPMFFDNPQLQKRILDAQRVSLAMIKTGSSTENAVSDFLNMSGIYNEVLSSL